MNVNFWRDKRVLITGHTGFKGSWLTLWLNEMGADVTGFALPPLRPSLFEVAHLDGNVNSILGDIRDADLVLRVVKAAEPEIVFHMAAQPLVRYSYDHPVETYHTNVLGTVHLLDAIRLTTTVRAVVNITSDKCYENREWVWGYREQDPMGGFDPYSSSKGCAELVTTAFRNSYFPLNEYERHHVALASARAGNVIGGGDWAEDRLIPDVLRAFTSDRAVKIRSPQAVRPWQHVLEPLAGYLLLAERLYTEGPAFAGGWNFGPADSDARPVSWVVDYLTQLWGGTEHWVADGAHQPHEAHYLKLDCSKARQYMGWAPRWSLEEALRHVVAWHRAYESGEDMRRHTIDDIMDFNRSALKRSATAAPPSSDA